MSENSINISSFKAAPMSTVARADAEPVAVLKDGKPVFYIFSPELYQEFLDMLDDIGVAEIIVSRSSQPEIEVALKRL